MNQPLRTQQQPSKPRPDDDEEEEATGSPNDKVRGKTGQPGVLAAVPINQIQTPNQIVKTNISHKAA